MTYKGYEIRRVKTKFVKHDVPIEVEAWGIYANGDFKGSALTKEEATDCIDRLTAGELYRPREPRAKIQVTEYNTHGHVAHTKICGG